MSVRVQLRRDAGQVGPEHGPWLRSKQVSRTLGPPDPLALAEVVDAKSEALGWGLFSPESDIPVRMIAWGPRPPASDWLERRVHAALEARRRLGLGPDAETTGFREVNSEGDGLPGLVVDRYGPDRVVQITTAPMAARQSMIVEALQDDLAGDVIIIRAETAARREGFEAGIEGSREAPLRYRELGLELEVPAPPAQKTGAYHDQRDNRRRAGALAQLGGGVLLDLGCHVGGFALQAASRGVEVVAVDRSESALASGQANAARNGLGGIRWVKADMFGPLDDEALAGPFGTIVFDPPKVASTRRDRARAIDAMTRTVGRLVPRLAPHGLLVLCSCSHHVDVDGLDSVALRAAAGHGAAFHRIAVHGPGLDHPVAPGHAHGEYLRVAYYRRGAQLKPG